MKPFIEVFKIKFSVRSGLIFSSFLGAGMGWSGLDLTSEVWRVVWLYFFFTTVSGIKKSRESGLLAESLRSSHSRMYAHLLSIFQHSWVEVLSAYLLGATYLISYAGFGHKKGMLIPLLSSSFSSFTVWALALFYLLAQPLFIVLWAHVNARSVQPKVAVMIAVFIASFALPFDVAPEMCAGMFPLRLITSGSFLLNDWWIFSVIANTVFQLFIWLRVVMETERPIFYQKRFQHWSFALLIAPLLFSLKLNTYIPAHTFTIVVFALFFVIFILSDRWGNGDSKAMMSASTLRQWSLWPLTTVSLLIIFLSAIVMGLIAGVSILSLLRTYGLTAVQVFTVLLLLENAYLTQAKWQRFIIWLAILMQGVFTLSAAQWAVSTELDKYYFTRLLVWAQSYFYEQNEAMYLTSNALAWSWCYHILWLFLGYTLLRMTRAQQFKFYANAENKT